MPPDALLTLFCSLLLVSVHLFAGRLRFLGGIPRSDWLSMAGGFAVAYVFLHLLPELSEGQETLAETGVLEGLSHHVYVLALAGLVVFYGLERAAVTSRRTGKGSGEEAPPHVFWLHVVSFSLYNVLIGYLLLHREEQDLESLLLYTVAIALHFLVNDFGLREHHKHRYQKRGRWILAAAVLAGWGLGMFTEIAEPYMAGAFAFLAGGIVLNVLKEELPEERESRFSAFVLGCVVYAAVLLLVG